jgi:predicted ATPase
MRKDAVMPEPHVFAERYYNSLPETEEYVVHFHIHMGYDVHIEGEGLSEDEILEKAEEIFEDVDVSEFDFIDYTNEGII